MTAVTATELTALDAGVGFGTAPGTGIVRVLGPDATTFLQSLVSGDLDPVTIGSGARSLLLTPTGKMGWQFEALRCEENDWLLLVDGDGDGFAASLARFKIRVDVEVVDESERLGRLDVIGPTAPDALTAIGLEVPSNPLAHVMSDGCRVVRDDWGARRAAVLIGAPGRCAEVGEALGHDGAVVLGPAAFELARIDAGRARFGFEIDERTIPQEAFLDVDHVSFTKGCFLGQELVCRIDARGHVNRFLRRLDLASVVPDGGAIVVDGATVGAVTSVVERPDGRAVGLGYVRREVTPPASGLVGGAAVEISAIPVAG